jgi:Protein of unknown function (DUF5818)
VPLTPFDSALQGEVRSARGARFMASREAVCARDMAQRPYQLEFPKINQSEGEKMKKLVMSIAACMTLAPGFAVAATFKGEIMDEACAKGGGHESMFKKEGTNDAKACTLACVKAGSKFVLFNPDKTFYELSDQKKPSTFAGQQVEVAGTLDKATKTIHVTAIKAAS